MQLTLSAVSPCAQKSGSQLPPAGCWAARSTLSQRTRACRRLGACTGRRVAARRGSRVPWQRDRLAKLVRPTPDAPHNPRRQCCAYLQLVAVLGGQLEGHSQAVLLLLLGSQSLVLWVPVGWGFCFL